MSRRLATTLFVLTAALALARLGHAASVDGIELYSTSSGSGPTIVFVHGWTCDTSSWREQLPAFAADHRVIALDLPGHGQSDTLAAEDFSMDLFARAVEAVRAEAGADRIVLVGHSMGVPVIRQYAIDYPERVAGLVAVDGVLDLRTFQAPPADPSITIPLEARENMIRGMFVPETPPALQEHILQMMLGAPAATASGAAAAMFDPAIRTADMIGAPVLAVYAGTADVPDVDALRDIVPDLQAVKLGGTGHFLMLEKPAEFNRLVAAFLDRIGF